MEIGYHTITWGGVVGATTGVTSIKDLYYRANGSMEGAIADIGAAGYRGVEMFDGNVADYADRGDELREALATAGVRLASVYTGANFIYKEVLPDELYRVARAAELAATFGAASLVVGGGARRASGTLAALDRVVELADSYGITACYHPHLTTIAETPEEFDRLISCSRISFCPDTGHLAAGGGNPAELIRRYPDRVRYLHLKDFRSDPFAFLPLGEGQLDFPDILGAVREIGYDGWIVVELDSYEGDPAEAAQISKRYLEKLVDGSAA